MSEPSKFFQNANQWVQNSVTVRLFVIAFLVLILLIPVSWVKDLIKERESRQNEVIREVSSKWGLEQVIAGPFLTIPYFKEVKYSTGDKENDYKIEKVKHYAYFLPESLEVDGEVKEELRHRSLFKVVLYNAGLNLKGHFERPDFSEWGVKEENIDWSAAQLSLGLNDLRSVQSQIAVNWNGKQVDLNPGLPSKEVVKKGISCRLDLTEGKQFTFNIPLNFNGSSELHFIPLGKESTVNLQSSWPNPSFVGAFLPDRSSGDAEPDFDKGFDETWNILHLNRSYPQQFLSKPGGIAESAFGVRLLLPMAHYAKSMRSAKYAILIISLTFLVFFFVQILNRIYLHPFQYLLVGLALTVFYTLLLSISEHLGFALGYGISAFATIGLITLYTVAIFKSKRHSAILGLILSMLYVFVYVILQSQDYALLIGSIGLFITLAIAMYLSRNIDWKNPSNSQLIE